MEWGTVAGLSADFQADKRINDLYRQEEALNRTKAMAESKAALFANDTRYQNAMNSWDHAIVKKKNQERIYALGAWQRENPDWSYNPQKRAQYQNMVDEIKSNEDVVRGMASDAAFKALNADLQDLASKGKQYNKRAYNELLMQRDNYLKYGNQNGYDAAQNEGYKAFTYIKPKEFIDDMAGDLMKAGDAIQDYNVVKPKNGNIGEWYGEVDPNTFNSVKQSKFEQHRDQLIQMAQDNGWNEKQLDEYITNNIKAGVKKNWSLGDPNAAWNRYIQSEHLRLAKDKADAKLQGGYYQPWDYFIDPQNHFGNMSEDDIKTVYGDTPKDFVYGSDGSKIDVSDLKVSYTGKYIKNQGLPFFLGKINMPVKVAEDKGIYSEPWGPDFGRNPIASPYLKIARVKKGTDKDGNAYDYVEVDYNLAVNPHDKVARDKFNALILPDKMLQPAGNPFAQERPQTVVQNGFTYTFNPATGKYE